jgi:hypothetical protein
MPGGVGGGRESLPSTRFGAASDRDMALSPSRMALTLRLGVARRPFRPCLRHTDHAHNLHSPWDALCRWEDALGHFWQTSPMTRQLS